MKFKVAHRTPNRLRIVIAVPANTGVKQLLTKELMNQTNVTSFRFYRQSSSLEIYFSDGAELIFKTLQKISDKTLKKVYLEQVGKEQPPDGFAVVSKQVYQRVLQVSLLPAPIRLAATLYQFIPFIKRGLKDLISGRLTMNVLDFTAISALLLMKQSQTAGSIIFLLKLGESLETIAEQKSILDLEASLAQQLESVWRIKDKQRALISSSLVEVDDVIVVSSGKTIPYDGQIVKGEGMVNQTSITGESLGVYKQKGDSVYSTTILENGELQIQISNTSQQSRGKEIIQLILNSEETKSQTETQLISQADKLVKYNFLGMVLTFLLTRSWAKTLSFLLVDFSCAFKLSTPISYLTAIKAGAEEGIIVKGNKYIELLSEIDTIVFDKTGTLTTEVPKVVKTIPFNNFSQAEVIRIAACLEEHYYHPLGTAIVQKAVEENIIHDEMHGDIFYIASKGIVSSIDQKRVVVGSEHFVLGEEKIVASVAQTRMMAKYATDYHLLYLGYDNQLIAIFCIANPLRPEMVEVLEALAKQQKKLVLLTGDLAQRSQKVIGAIQFSDAKFQVTPADKYTYILQEQEAGHKVLMIGDGLNDSAALSAADIGVTLKNASDLSRQVSNVILVSDTLKSLLVADELSKALKSRLKANVRWIVSLNSSLIGAGLFGLLTSKQISLMHNLTTIFLVGKSMKPYKKIAEKTIN